MRTVLGMTVWHTKSPKWARTSVTTESESFVRAVDRTDAPVPEDDLFAGLR